MYKKNYKNPFFTFWSLSISSIQRFCINNSFNPLDNIFRTPVPKMKRIFLIVIGFSNFAKCRTKPVEIKWNTYPKKKWIKNTPISQHNYKKKVKYNCKNNSAIPFIVIFIIVVVYTAPPRIIKWPNRKAE